MGTLRTTLPTCTCGIGSKTKLERVKFFVGLYAGGAVSIVLLVLGVITREPRAFLVLGVLILVTIFQWTWNYSKYVKARHSRSCARRFAWIKSISVGPMY